jgi:zinc-ribbon domain
MFCPECGQQQVSDEVRFCSRCGFQLAGVSGLLATRGALTPGEAAPAPETPRRKGVRQGAKFFLIGIFLIPCLFLFAEIFRPGIPEEVPIAGVITALGGILRLIYAMLFEDGPYRRRAGAQTAYVPPAAPVLSAQPRAAARLPAAQGMPARDYAAPRPDTAEISYRPSVTEHETQLLDDERDPRAR